MQVFETLDQLNELISANDRVVITSYRGDWCPFCRKYLSQFDKAFRQLDDSNTAVYAISIDSPEQNQALAKKLGIEKLTFLTDQQRLMASEYKVATSNSHGKDRHLQPAVFIFHKGQKVFEWIQTPKLLNLGGASSRIPVDKVVQQLSQLN